jgi:hypothetical protein
MPEGFFGLFVCVCGPDDLQPLAAFGKVPGHAAFSGFLAAILTVSA